MFLLASRTQILKYFDESKPNFQYRIKSLAFFAMLISYFMHQRCTMEKKPLFAKIYFQIFLLECCIKICNPQGSKKLYLKLNSNFKSDSFHIIFPSFYFELLYTSKSRFYRLISRWLNIYFIQCIHS